MADAFTLLRPLIHGLLPPEAAHALGLWALGRGLLSASAIVRLPALEVTAFGLAFASPIGLAAGFDKNALVIDALLDQGFGFVEAGTVTPLPQPGNPRPRIFRLSCDEAVINRLGFNNDGLEAFLKHFRQRDHSKGIAGINIGKNKEGSPIADYVTGLQAVYPYADYITVNISSPNTPGLRDLQARDTLRQLLKMVRHVREECAQTHGKNVPLLLKVAPDLNGQEKEDVAEAALAYGINGLIISNTTVSRPEYVKSRHAREQGGLSGRPLFALSTQALKDFYQLTGGRIPLVGVGGIGSAEDAYAKIRAGATLVQLYTALVYQGFGVAREIQEGLAELLKRDGFSHVQQAVGVDCCG